jgi:flagellar hook-length control protein FliK
MPSDLMEPALAASPALGPRASTSPRAVANTRNDGGPRGRSSSVAHQSDAFGEALDGAQQTRADDRATTRVEGERHESVHGARGRASRREESSARTEKDESKDKQSSDGVAAPITAPVLRLPEANAAPSGASQKDGARTHVDKATGASGVDLQQDARATVTQGEQAAGMLVDVAAVTDTVRGEAPKAAIETAATAATTAHGGAAAALAKAAAVPTAEQATADASVSLPSASTDANVQPPDAPSIKLQESSVPLPSKGTGQGSVAPIGTAANASVAERAAARKRAAELLGASTAATNKVPSTAALSDASKQSAVNLPEASANVPAAASARHPGAGADRPAMQAGQLAGSGTFMTTTADSSQSHGDASAGRQHQPAFDDRRVRDALATASAASGHTGTQPLTVPVESQAPFARLIDGPEALAAPAVSPAAAMASVDEQVIRGIQLQMRDGGGEARIHLRPEHLGDVVVEMRVERDGVVATLRADTPAVRGWLASHQDDLRAGLADVGLHLEHLTVSDREAPQDQRRDPAQDEAPRRQRREQVAGGGRFEVDV